MVHYRTMKPNQISRLQYLLTENHSPIAINLVQENSRMLVVSKQCTTPKPFGSRLIRVFSVLITTRREERATNIVCQSSSVLITGIFGYSLPHVWCTAMGQFLCDNSLIIARRKKIESTNIHRRILFCIHLNLVSSSFCIYTTPCVRSFFLFKFDYIGCD